MARIEGKMPMGEAEFKRLQLRGVYVIDTCSCGEEVRAELVDHLEYPVLNVEGAESAYMYCSGCEEEWSVPLTVRLSVEVHDPDRKKGAPAGVVEGNREFLNRSFTGKVLPVRRAGALKMIPEGYMDDQRHVFLKGSSYNHGQGFCPICDAYRDVYSPDGEKQ